MYEHAGNVELFGEVQCTDEVEGGMEDGDWEMRGRRGSGRVGRG